MDYTILHHTLGITRPGVAKPYRNHFVAGEGHADMPEIERLVEAGLMKQAPAPAFAGQGGKLFVVTEKGVQVAMETRPKE